MKLTSLKLIALQLSALLLFSSQARADEFDVNDLPDVVLLDIYADYCNPCRQMVPLLQNMQRDGFPVRKIDFQRNSDLCKNHFKALALPTLIVMVEGKEVKRFEGFTSEATLRKVMNQASRKLHADRQVARRDTLPNPTRVASASSATVGDAPRTGLASFFDRFKSSADDQAATSELTDAEIRAQSPDESLTAQERNSAPHRATVRVRLMDGKKRDVGTGTVIHSVPGESTILTCAHIFKDAAADAVIEVDVFQGDKTLKYPATVLGGDHNADVALLRIKNAAALKVAQVGFDRPELQKQESLFSIGCSNGDPPTRLKMNVVDVNRFEGPATILCTNAPIQGRSGGGLFDADNQLVGICSAADYKAGEGLYCGLPPLKQLMERLKLTSLLQHQTAERFDGAVVEQDALQPDQSPFPTDDGIFDALFAETVDSQEDPQAATTMAGPATIQTGLRDPFGAANSLANSAGDAPANPSGSEITVIIKDPTAPNGQKVVVIPQASPWLLKLLTGEG